MNWFSSNKKYVLLLLFITTATHTKFFSQKQTPSTSEKPFDEITYSWTRTLAEVLGLVNDKHYKVSKWEECWPKTIDTLLSSLDPHSNFLDPKTYKHMLETTSGEFFGIGIVIDNTRTNKDKALTVVDTIPDGPADRAGVKPLDKILEINGEQLDGMSTDEATAKLKGEKGTKVHIKLLREGQPDLMSFDITRDVIKDQNSLCFYLPEQNVYYLSLNMFTHNAIKQIEELIKKSHQTKYKGLILDLRNNSGGLLNAVVDIAGLFLDKGSLVVTTKDKSGNETERYVTTKNPIANNTIPIVILINNYTASAAEILAGCLKIHSDDLSKASKNEPQKKLMVFLVGTNTFGKGSVQEVIPVSNNCAIKLTTSLYFLPHDISIQGEGIAPDFEVERNMPPTDQVNWFNTFYGREKALNNYIKNPNAKEEAPKKKKELQGDKRKSWSKRAKKMLKHDNQFRDAINILNMLFSAQSTCPEKVSNRQKAVDFLNLNYLSNKKLKLMEVKI